MNNGRENRGKLWEYEKTGWDGRESQKWQLDYTAVRRSLLLHPEKVIFNENVFFCWLVSSPPKWRASNTAQTLNATALADFARDCFILHFRFFPAKTWRRSSWLFKSFGGVDAAMSRCYLLPEHCETTKKLLPAAARKWLRTNWKLDQEKRN